MRATRTGTAVCSKICANASAGNSGPGAATVERVLVLFSAGDFDGAEAALAGLRAAHPEDREADLLQSLVLGTRWILDGESDPHLLARGGGSQFDITMFGDEPTGNYNRSSLAGSPRGAQRTLITQVRAARSWKARFSFSKKAHAQPSPSGRPARTQTIARMKAAGQPMPRPAGVPRRTTARPRSDLPGVRPRQAQPPTT